MMDKLPGIAASKGHEASKTVALGPPALLFVMIASTVFISEAAVMFVLSFLPPLSVTVTALLDALILVCVLFPVFHVLLFRRPATSPGEISKTRGRRAQAAIEPDTVYRSPALLLIVTAALIFLSETMVMLLPLTSRFSTPVAALVDSLILVAMLFPALYLLIFRPSSLHIDELAKANEQLRESDRRIRTLSYQILTAQEAERRRVSRELHEELAQALFSFKLRLRSIVRNLNLDQGRFAEECESILCDMDQVIRDVQRLSKALGSSLLEDLGLWAALRSLASDFSGSHGIEVSLDLGEMQREFSSEVRAVLYRSIQEALNNAAKHSQATRVSISVEEGDEDMRFTVADNGRGFDVEAAMALGPSQGRLGLATMMERMGMIGGSLDVHSEERGGTRLRLSVPISIATA